MPPVRHDFCAHVYMQGDFWANLQGKMFELTYKVGL